MTRSILMLAVLALVSLAAWTIGEQLSADALGMAVGFAFGVTASIPTALLVLAAGQRADARRERQERRRERQQQRLDVVVRHVLEAPQETPESVEEQQIVVIGDDQQRQLPGD